MTGPERRQTPRTTLDKHAYINIEPNNGGIVLNVSDGGLCVHSFDPVPRNGKVRFWFSDNGHRVEADGTLVWTDETQKGGLRFISLPAEAREKISDWMRQPSMPVAADPVPVGPRPRQIPSVPAPDTKAAPAESASLPTVPPELRVPMPLSGFSRGLATGLMVSAVIAAGVFFHNYRREFGESLIRLGERFAAKSEAPTITASAASAPVSPPVPVEAAKSRQSPPSTRGTSPVAQAVSPEPRSVSTVSAPSAAARTEKALPQPKKTVPPPLASPAKSQPTKLESAESVPATPVAARDIASDVSTNPENPAAAAASSLTAPPMLLSSNTPAPGSATSGAPGSNLDKPGTPPKFELVNQPDVHTEASVAQNADSSRELYFEVGKFKNVFQAHGETDKLAQLGFPVTAVQKGFLWSNSIHVLVGPYGDEEQAKATHQTLLSSGFKPRPFEKGWRNFTLLSPVTLNGARAPEGDYTISWESYIGDASVKLMRNSSVIATANGRWVKRDAKYPRDAYVYKRNADGSRTLLEIHFGGMHQALVFGKS